MANREAAIGVLAGAWLAAVAAGLWAWERYDATPGTAGAATAAANEPARGHWQLTLFAHPHCPCSRAAIRELAEIARAEPRLAVRVLFVRPAGAREGWERGDSWAAASAVGGAAVACDADGREARRLGAETSGFAVLADPSGRGVFRGGLTQGRGRAGESAGRRAVLGWVRAGAGASAAPVYGCPLFAPDE